MPSRLESPTAYGDFALRPVHTEDEEEWNRVRWGNQDWLRAWESNDPQGGPGLTFSQWIAAMRRGESTGSGAIFLMEYHMAIVGQISLGAICYGSMRTATVGYWVDQAHIGRGFAPLALALLADWAFYAAQGPHLHRIEVAILPENSRSLRVVAKLGMRAEGLKHSYMFVGGRWRDHLTFSLLAEDCQGSVLGRLQANYGDTPGNA